MEIITSVKNQYVRQARALAERKYREETGLFLVEGANLIKDLPPEADVAYFLVSERRALQFEQLLANTRARVYYVSDAVMRALSDTETPYGIAAVAKIPEFRFAPPKGNALLLDGVSDPGNLGTILRTAAARGFCDVYLLECADVWSPKCVRASLGGIFRTRIFRIGEREAVDIAGSTDSVALDAGGQNVKSMALNSPTLLIAGSEAHGIRAALRAAAKRTASLPMENSIESLNVAVAVAVAMYMTDGNQAVLKNSEVTP